MARVSTPRFGRRELREIAFIFVGLLIYYFIRGYVADEFPEARAHALAIVHLERGLRLFWEPQVQRLLMQGQLQIRLWDAIYFWGHAPVMLAVGVWLYFWHRRHYSLVRNAFLASAIIGLIIYWLYPVAPPRLLTGFGFIDTMQQYSSLSYQAQSLKPFVNPYAAVPSLHVGWSFLIGVGLILGFGRPLGWALGILLPLLMFCAIMATANHFFFDAVAGLAVCAVSLGIALAVQRWQQARRAATRPAPHELPEPVRV